MGTDTYKAIPII